MHRSRALLLAVALGVVASTVIAAPSFASEEDLSDLYLGGDDPEDIWNATPDEALLEDLQVIATQENITLSAATEAYGWHNAFNDLTGQLRDTYPSTYAGARAATNGASVAWIAFEGLAPSAAISLIDSFPEQITVHQGRGFDEQALDTDLTTVHYALLARTDIVAEINSGYDIETGEINLEVAPKIGKTASQMNTAIAAEVSSLGLSTPVNHTLVASAQAEGDVYLLGGHTLTNGCTSGLNVKVGSVRGVVTSGHCADSASYDTGVSLQFQSAHYGTWGDIQWYKAAGHTITDDFKKAAGVTGDVTAVQFAAEDTYLCKYGRSTGKTCDKVYQLNHCGGTPCHLTAMYNRYANNGDSGGPVYLGSVAYGIHQGKKWHNLQWRDLFMPADYFNEAIANMTVATS